MSNIGHNQTPTVNVNSLTQEDKKKIKHVIQLLNDSMTRVASEKELQKDEVDALYQTMGINKKLIKRLAKAYFKANYNEEVEANNTFESFYSLIVKGEEEKKSNG